MNAQHFYEGMEQLSSFFGKKLMSQQHDYYFKELSYIPKDSFMFAVRSIQKGRKPNPGNFPTIEEIQGICPPKTSAHSYHEGETDEQYYNRITITHLWEALNILKNQGQDQFFKYCQRLNFSEDDIDRVQCKFKTINHKFNFELKGFPKINHEKRIGELRNQAKDLTGEIPF